MVGKWVKVGQVLGPQSATQEWLAYLSAELVLWCYGWLLY